MLKRRKAFSNDTTEQRTNGFPPGTTVESHSKPLSKTMVLILWVATPFVGQMTFSQGLHNSLDIRY